MLDVGHGDKGYVGHQPRGSGCTLDRLMSLRHSGHGRGGMGTGVSLTPSELRELGVRVREYGEGGTAVTHCRASG